MNLGNASAIDFTGVGFSLSFASGVATFTGTASGGGGAVASVFGRTGTVTAQAGDYSGVYQPSSAVLDATTAAFTTALLSKLNGIEAGATADMTGAEIVSAVNANLGGTDWQTGGSGSVTLNSMTTAASAGDAAGKLAFVQAIGLPAGVVAVSANRALAATDAGQVLQVANGVALTLDSGSLTGAGDAASMLPAIGAAYTLVVGTATLRTRTGGAALAGASVISSASARDGEIVVRRESDGTYLLLAPAQNEVFTTITASAAFPNSTTARLARYFVNVASGNVTLTIASGQFPADPQMSGVEIVVLGGGSNTCTVAAGASVTLQVQGSASAGSGKSIVVRCDPLTANFPRVAA